MQNALQNYLSNVSSYLEYKFQYTGTINNKSIIRFAEHNLNINLFKDEKTSQFRLFVLPIDLYDLSLENQLDIGRKIDNFNLELYRIFDQYFSKDISFEY